MQKKHIAAGIVILIGLIFAGGYETAAHFARARELKAVQTREPSAQTILIALKGQGFLITQTYLLDQSVTVDHASGSFFKDLFWNQIVTASANVKISSGVDLAKLSAADIGSNGNTLTIGLPQPTRYSTEIVGAVNVQNKQGVLKKLIDSDDGYNQALAALKAEAEKAAQTPEILQDLQNQTKNEVERLIKIISPSTSVSIIFK